MCIVKPHNGVVLRGNNSPYRLLGLEHTIGKKKEKEFEQVRRIYIYIYTTNSIDLNTEKEYRERMKYKEN
jgi:hypothetical protein